jgi:DNA-binding response OmpR family regulator
MRRILVVDDDTAVRESLSELLAGRYEVLVARDGEDALRMLDAGPVDAVVLDMLMPVLDGVGFLRAARARGFTAPVILVSAQSDLRARARTLGVADYLQKPYAIARLEAKLARALGGGGGGATTHGLLSIRLSDLLLAPAA